MVRVRPAATPAAVLAGGHREIRSNRLVRRVYDFLAAALPEERAR